LVKPFGRVAFSMELIVNEVKAMDVSNKTNHQRTNVGRDPAYAGQAANISIRREKKDTLMKAACADTSRCGRK